MSSINAERGREGNLIFDRRKSAILLASLENPWWNHCRDHDPYFKSKRKKKATYPLLCYCGRDDMLWGKSIQRKQPYPFGKKEECNFVNNEINEQLETPFVEKERLFSFFSIHSCIWWTDSIMMMICMVFQSLPDDDALNVNRLLPPIPRESLPRKKCQRRWSRIGWNERASSNIHGVSSARTYVLVY
jgi:hypothetical protein